MIYLILHDRIFSLKGGYVPKNSLPSPLFNVLLECLYQTMKLIVHVWVNKRWRKPQGKHKISNSETPATLGTKRK